MLPGVQNPSGRGTSDRVALATPHLDVKSNAKGKRRWAVDSQRMHLGSCLCGAVRFEVKGIFNGSIFVTAGAAAMTQGPHTRPT
jgi:hypothetical protein